MAIKIIRIVGSLLILLFLVWYASRAGFAALLYTYAARAAQSNAADAAVNLSPVDADAHYIRGAIFEADGDRSAAEVEYARAVSLRPADYVLWLSLSRLRELNGQMSSAISAAEQAVQRAPFYSQPHWQLGNLLIRSGDQDRGFAELRLATATNPMLLPAAVDLAWQLSGGDTERVKHVIQPNSSEAYIALADCFRKHERVADAVAIMTTQPDAADYRRRFLDELISGKRFQDAYNLWLLTQPRGAGDQAITNPGFEQEADLDQPGFGWRAKKTPTVSLALDQVNPAEGKSCLDIEFKGESEMGAAVLTQLVIVETGAHYQLHFAARTENIVSGSLPSVTIADAVSGQHLADAGTFPQTSNGWHEYTVDFIVPAGTSAIQIAVQRKSCPSTPCPIFGHLWLDRFSIKKLGGGSGSV